VIHRKLEAYATFAIQKVMLQMHGFKTNYAFTTGLNNLIQKKTWGEAFERLKIHGA